MLNTSFFQYGVVYRNPQTRPTAEWPANGKLEIFSGISPAQLPPSRVTRPNSRTWRKPFFPTAHADGCLGAPL